MGPRTDNHVDRSAAVDWDARFNVAENSTDCIVDPTASAHGLPAVAVGEGIHAVRAGSQCGTVFNRTVLPDMPQPQLV